MSIATIMEMAKFVEDPIGFLEAHNVQYTVHQISSIYSIMSDLFYICVIDETGSVHKLKISSEYAKERLGY